jgi:hypothetical protein
MPRTALLAVAFLAACEGGTASPPDGASPDLAPAGPTRLSETGLYSDFANRTLAEGVRPYSVRYELWADGATKQRYLYLPPGSQVDTSDMDRWSFPAGTKAWKEFRVDGRLVETRLLYKTGADVWWRSAYVWNDDESDAIASPLGEMNARGTTHDVPARDDCARCHGKLTDTLTGVGAIQLSAPDRKGTLSQLAAAGLLSVPPAAEFQPPGSGAVQDALGYLHGNCGAPCHHENDNPALKQWLLMQLKVGDLLPEDTATYRTGVGAKMRHTMPGGIDTGVVPGMPDQSQLYLRMHTRDETWLMPPLASEVVDEAGSSIVREWILSLPP